MKMIFHSEPITPALEGAGGSKTHNSFLSMNTSIF